MTASFQEDKFGLVRAAIDAAELVRLVREGQDGAIVTFDGFVRNESHGRETSYLEYEAYESMALGKMKEIAAQIHEKFAIHRVAIVHRLGRLEIGETSVFIAVSAPHRGAAFDACRFAIDTLKHGAHLEERVFRGWRGMGGWGAASDTPKCKKCILAI